jgi:hypothetical protein
MIEPFPQKAAALSAGQRVLPGRLSDSRDLAFISQVTEADSADSVIPQVSVRTAADLAAVVASGGELGFSLLL